MLERCEKNDLLALLLDSFAAAGACMVALILSPVLTQAGRQLQQIRVQHELESRTRLPIRHAGGFLHQPGWRHTVTPVHQHFIGLSELKVLPSAFSAPPKEVEAEIAGR
jgi:hypothetical protein